MTIEKKMRKFLKMLNEQGENEQNPTQPNINAPTPYLATQKYEPQNLQAKRIEYLPTNNLFISKPPTNSTEWADEKNKKYYLPLIEGRVGRVLVNVFKKHGYFHPTGPYTAARYREFQFQIILGGDLDANVDIQVTVNSENSYTAELTRFETYTPLGLKIWSKNEIKMYDINKISGDVDTSEFFKKVVTFKKTESEEKTEELKNEIIDKYKDTVLDTIKANYKSLNLDKDEIKDYADWVLKHKWRNISSIQDAVKESIKKDNAEKFKEQHNFKEEKLNLSHYIKKLLLEDENKTLEKELGADIVVDLNKKLFSNWYGVKKIAPKTSMRVFEGAMNEWYAASGATFKVSERSEVIEKKEGELKFLLKGKITSEAEIWIDARIGENGDLKTWTFRIHDAPNKPFLTRAFRFGGRNRENKSPETKEVLKKQQKL